MQTRFSDLKYMIKYGVFLSIIFFFHSCSESTNMTPNTESETRNQPNYCDRQSMPINVQNNAIDVKNLTYNVIDYVRLNEINTDADFDAFIFENMSNPSVSTFKNWLNYASINGTEGLLNEFIRLGKISSAYGLQVKTLITELDLL